MNTLASTTPALDLKLPIHGMICSSCVRRVEDALTSLPGVEATSVNLAAEVATIRASAAVAADALVAAVRQAGY